MFVFLIFIMPGFGFISLQRHLKTVVFPAPFVPISPKHSPFSTLNYDKLKYLPLNLILLLIFSTDKRFED